MSMNTIIGAIRDALVVSLVIASIAVCIIVLRMCT